MALSTTTNKNVPFAFPVPFASPSDVPFPSLFIPEKPTLQRPRGALPELLEPTLRYLRELL